MCEDEGCNGPEGVGGVEDIERAVAEGGLTVRAPRRLALKAVADRVGRALRRPRPSSVAVALHATLGCSAHNT